MNHSQVNLLDSLPEEIFAKIFLKLDWRSREIMKHVNETMKEKVLLYEERFSYLRKTAEERAYKWNSLISHRPRWELLHCEIGDIIKMLYNESEHFVGWFVLHLVPQGLFILNRRCSFLKGRIERYFTPEEFNPTTLWFVRLQMFFLLEHPELQPGGHSDSEDGGRYLCYWDSNGKPLLETRLLMLIEEARKRLGLGGFVNQV